MFANLQFLANIEKLLLKQTMEYFNYWQIKLTRWAHYILYVIIAKTIHRVGD